MNILQYDLEGNFLQLFENKSKAEICRNLNIDYTGLINCLAGKIESTKNFQFRKQHLNRVPFKIGDLTDNSYGSESIHKFFNGRYISSYKSIQDASSKNKIDISLISRCSNGEISETSGYNFKKII